MRAKGDKRRRAVSDAAAGDLPARTASDAAGDASPGTASDAAAGGGRSGTVSDAAAGGGRSGAVSDAAAGAVSDAGAGGRGRPGRRGGSGGPAGPGVLDGDGPAHAVKSGRGAPAQPPGGAPGRRALRNWRVRSRLLLLVAIPTLTALIFGGFSIVSSVRSYQTYQRVEQLAMLGKDVTQLTQSLEDERDQIVFYISLSSQQGGRAAGLSPSASVRADASPELISLGQQYRVTDRAAATVRTLGARITAGYPAPTQQAATALLEAVTPVALTSLRTAATQTQLPLLVVVQKYGQTINTALAFNSDIGQGAGDPALAQAVNVLGLVSAMQADASEQRGILAAALNQGSFAPGQLTALQDSLSSQQTSLQAFDEAATPAQHQSWNNAVATSDYDLASGEEQQALSIAASSGPSLSLANDPTTPDDWYSDMSNTVHYQMGSVEQHLVGAIISRAGTLRRNAITTAAIVGAIVLIVFAVAMLFTIVVGRSMVRPLRRLRSDALSIAGVQLPGMVRRLSESEGEEGEPEVRPIAVDSSDEIGEVARAFDQVHAEAVRLASNEARLRGNVNAMFVNLSRRSQSLVERQIHLIDDLEQGEQDSERLSSLFRLDHLATRMRRNSDNLLVLAGHEAARRWSQPIALVDVLRAAVSEIEHYERVVLNVQPGIAVRGHVVNDVVHLLAELVENATAFSPAQTQVTVSGHLLNSGGVLLDITDQGVGMMAEEMAHANWRLDNPPVVDVSVSRRMGLFVVARLASRHGIRVRLRPAPAGGLTALIWLPDETVTHETSGMPSGLRRFDVDTAVVPATLEGLEEFSLERPAGRSAAQSAVAAARAPRFSATQAESEAGQMSVPEPAGQPGGDGDSLPEPAGEPLPVRDDGVPPAGEVQPPLPVRGAPQAQGNGALALGDGRDAEPPLPVRGNGPPHLPGNGSSPPGDDVLLPARDDEPLPARDGWPAAGQEDAPSQVVHDGPVAGRDGEREPVFGAPPADLTTDYGAAGLTQANPAAGAEPSSARSSLAGDVVVPPAPASEDNRLPIFESVESDWFRRGKAHVGGPAPEDGNRETATDWGSPADEGWQAAEAVESPSWGGVTAAGLPRRIPQANLVPGSVAAAERAASAGLVRSAVATRQRMASFQRGSRQGREALQDEEAPAGDDEDGS